MRFIADRLDADRVKRFIEIWSWHLQDFGILHKVDVRTINQHVARYIIDVKVEK